MDKRNLIVEITNEGSCLFIWSDENPLAMLGDVEVTRLSDVEFNNDLKGWEVTFRNGVKLPGLYKQRIEALNEEINWVEDHLSEMGDWALAQLTERTSQYLINYVDPSLD